MSFIEKPDHFGRSVVVSIAVWGTVALTALAGFKIAFPPRTPGLGGTPCNSTVWFGGYDPSAANDPATSVVTAPSRCAVTGSIDDPRSQLHAYLEGAELNSGPVQPPPTVDASLLVRGADLYGLHCAVCHGTSGDGVGHDACALEIPAAVHKNGVYTLRTTEHEALPTDEDIFRTITRGIHGSAMPPWFPLPERDRWALVAHVKSLSKQFDEDVAPPSLDFGKVPEATPERISAGRALFATGGCASCHGATGHGDGIAASALSVKPRDFTSGRFHRGSSAADIHATLVTGLDGTPMGSFAKVMTDDELWNVSLFVHDLAPLMVERNGLRCPEAAKPISSQELFGIRNLMNTTHLGL